MADVNITRKCKEQTCHKEFSMSAEEVLWYTQQGLEIPKRCPECRKRNKERAANKEKTFNTPVKAGSTVTR